MAPDEVKAWSPPHTSVDVPHPCFTVSPQAHGLSTRGWNRLKSGFAPGVPLQGTIYRVQLIRHCTVWGQASFDVAHLSFDL